MNNFTFRLIKETTIDINMKRFIEKINQMCDYNKKWKTECPSWLLQISVIVEEMTLQDIWEFDNYYEITRQIVVNAITYSRAKNDNNSVETLQGILQSIDRNK